MLSIRVALIILACLFTALWMLTPTASADEKHTKLAKDILAAFTSRVRPLEVAANRAWWDANMTGKKEAYKAKEDAQNKLDAVLADKQQFAGIKAIKESGKIDDPVTRRAIDVIYLACLEKQLDADLLKALTKLGNEIEEIFSNFRPEIADGKGVRKITDGELRKILKTSTISERRKEAWEASKVLGQKVEPGLKKLVKLRNEAATKLGFANFHAMQLALNEQNGADLIKLFDPLDELTREPFTKAKAAMDAELVKQSNLQNVADLMTWH